jgi:hypothetical protein
MVFRIGSSTSYSNIPLGEKAPTALVTIYPYSSYHWRFGHDSSCYSHELYLLGNCQVYSLLVLSNSALFSISLLSGDGQDGGRNTIMFLYIPV